MRASQQSLQRKLTIHLINWNLVAMKSTNHDNSAVTQLDIVVEHPICRKAAKIAKIQAMWQILVLVWVSATGLQITETHRHLMGQRVSMVAKRILDVTVNHLFVVLVATWTKSAVMLPWNMIIAWCAALSDVLWPLPAHGDGVNMPQRYQET